MSEFEKGEPLAPRPRHWIEYVSTFVALVVSVISLWVAIATERANQQMVDANYRMVAAASWPFLQINSGNEHEGKRQITLNLQNAGVGPAKIETFEVFWKGKAYRSSGALFHDCCNPPPVEKWRMGTQPVSGSVLRAGEDRPFVRLDPMSGEDASWAAFDRVRLQELTYRACYCSVFDECWVGDLTKLHARRVKACPIPATPYVE